MTKKTLKKILNPIILLLAINQLVTALIQEFQEGSAQILSDETFEFLHEGTGYVLVGLILLHLILNWDWIRINYFKGLSK